MRRPGPHFADHPRVRSGVFYFLLLLFLLQVIRWELPRWAGFHRPGPLILLDTLDQGILDQLKREVGGATPWTPRPTDPNSLEDYKGYLLGIPPQALDRLYEYQSGGGVLYDLEQFGQVSGLPDSALRALKPYLRFPPRGKTYRRNAPEAIPAGKDLNAVTAAELQSISGIGPVLSRRIVRFREALGGFLHPSQVYDVYGLKPQTAQKVIQAFPLKSKPGVEPVSINAASVEELASLLYLTREMAEAIVARRERQGPYNSLEELRMVKSIPGDKFDRIALYLGL